jgi:hypothetical protein
VEEDWSCGACMASLAARLRTLCAFSEESLVGEARI